MVNGLKEERNDKFLLYHDVPFRMQYVFVCNNELDGGVMGKEDVQVSCVHRVYSAESYIHLKYVKYVTLIHEIYSQSHASH